MQTPAIQSVEIKKNGRFWAVNVDEEILAIVLYKRGALAVEKLLRQLAGIKGPEPEPKADGSNPASAESAPAEKASKPAPKAKSKTSRAKKPARKASKAAARKS